MIYKFLFIEPFNSTRRSRTYLPTVYLKITTGSNSGFCNTSGLSSH